MLRYFSFLFLSIFSLAALAEGSKELRNNGTTNGSLHLSKKPQFTPFAQYNAPEENQLKIRVGDLSETIFLGLNNHLQGGGFVDDVPFRLVAPSGTVVYDGVIPDIGETGNIPDYASAAAGPLTLGDPSGYDPFIFPATEIGDYVLEFDLSGYSVNEEIDIHLFDVTVANDANQAIPGRLHAKGWQLSSEGGSNPFTAKVYPYGINGVVYEVEFQEMEPYTFVINFNSSGITNTNDFLNDRKSETGYATYPEFEVFLNPPDEILYPTNIKTVSLENIVENSDCENTSFCLNFKANAEGLLEGYIDVNNNQVMDTLNGDIFFYHYFDAAGEFCFPWDGKDKNGDLITDAEIEVISSFGYGVMHLPLYDVEANPMGYKINIVRPSGVESPVIFWDDSEITQGSTLGTPKVNTEGCDASSSGCHIWSGRGNSGSEETINTWWYSNLIENKLKFNPKHRSPVKMSYHADEHYNNDTLVCNGDAIGFFVFNDDTSHFDNSLYAYTWLVDGVASTFDVAQFNLTISGDHEVVLQAEDKVLGCVTSDTMLVTVLPSFVTNSTVTQPTCLEQGSIEVEITDGSTNPTIYWTEVSGSSLSLADLLAGDYHLNLSVAGYSANCNYSETFTINAPLVLPEISSINTTTANCGQSDGSAAVTMTNSTAQYEYNWDNAGYVVGESIRNSLDKGTYQLEIREQGSDCPIDTVINIEELLLSANAEHSDVICQKKGSIKVNASSGAAIVWNDGNTDFERMDVDAGTYHYTVSLPMAAACSFSESVEIVDASYSIPVAINVDGLSDRLYPGSAVSFSSSVLTVFYEWEIGDSVIVGEEWVDFTFQQAGDYDYTLEVQDVNGCKGVYSDQLQVVLPTPCKAAIPNAFSPNNDGMNDQLRVLGDFEAMDLQVYNRWGEAVFRSLSQQETWDGTFKGREANTGVYPFVLKITCPNEDGTSSEQTQIGDITLLR